MSLGIDEARLEVQGALDAWDFSACWPTGSTADKRVITVPDWPMDLIQNIRKGNSNMLSNPIISIIPIAVPSERRSLGEVQGAGAVQGTTRYARRLLPRLSVDCWADLQTGGGRMVEKLAAQVQACLFVNASSLATYRRLKAEASHLVYDGASMLWHLPITVDGMLVMSYDK